jgi:hypothetical protein
MEAELKVGDEVFYRNTPGGMQKGMTYRIVEIITTPSPNPALHSNDKNLYGREIDKLSLPHVHYVIEPRTGGEQITVQQGEIDSV